MIQTYVCGLLFDSQRYRVILIEKKRPERMKGKLLGVGGKVEPGESPRAAMIREFREETSLDIRSWDYFMTLSGGDRVIHFYRAFLAREVLDLAETVTDETVLEVHLNDLKHAPLLPNMRWIIPMALSMDEDQSSYFSVTENYGRNEVPEPKSCRRAVTDWVAAKLIPGYEQRYNDQGHLETRPQEKS